MFVKMIHETVEKKLKEKDDEIQCFEKLNWMLKKK